MRDGPTNLRVHYRNALRRLQGEHELYTTGNMEYGRAVCDQSPFDRAFNQDFELEWPMQDLYVTKKVWRWSVQGA